MAESQSSSDSKTPSSWRRQRILLPLVVLIIVIIASVFAASHKAEADCGKVTIDNTTVHKSNPPPIFTGCFDQHYASCSQATKTIDYEGTGSKGTISKYTINKKVSNGCQVTWSYIALPDHPDWAGQEAVCTFPSGSNFFQAYTTTDFSKICHGKLQDSINSLKKAK